MALYNVQPGIYVNQVWHRRNYPTVNEFNYESSYIWLDPEDPAEALDGIPFSGQNKWNPICFRSDDYLGNTNQPLFGQAAAAMLDAGIDTDGMSMRLLTQPRLWGWLFNPISIYLFFDNEKPAASLLEVTNTPWKESHLYAVTLEPNRNKFVARFSKQLHVSPFLDMNYDYLLTVDDQSKAFQVDVIDESGEPILNTAIGGLEQSQRVRSLFTNPASTHKTSAAIHWQAFKLLKKRVDFVTHPGK